jgi:Protein of unknown function (DUF3662)/FHA domain
MGLQGFERRLERLVEGVFAKAFRGGLQPVELGRRLTREMDGQRTNALRGILVPNAFTFALSQADHERFQTFEDALTRELADAAREHAREEGYHFIGPVEVTLETDKGLSAGMFMLKAEVVEGEGGVVGALVTPEGRRIPVGDDPVTIGRLPECDIVLADSKVSRRHAEVRRDGVGVLVVDLGSTNGTQVNGAGVRERSINDGDTITVGNTILRFEAS